MGAYRFLPEALVAPIAFGPPALEISVGLLLPTGAFVRAAAIAAAVLLTVFIAAVASAWARGLSIDCGCFGGGGAVAPERTAYGRELVRDAALLALAGFLAAAPLTRLAWLDRAAVPGSSPQS